MRFGAGPNLIENPGIRKVKLYLHAEYSSTEHPRSSRPSSSRSRKDASLVGIPFPSSETHSNGNANATAP